MNIPTLLTLDNSSMFSNLLFQDSNSLQPCQIQISSNTLEPSIPVESKSNEIIEINKEMTPSKKIQTPNSTEKKNINEAEKSHEKITDEIEKTENNLEKEIIFQNLRCPRHSKEEISFICNATNCTLKFMCCKCLVDDLKNQTRHHIIHEKYLVQYDETLVKEEFEKITLKRDEFHKICQDQQFLLFEKLEKGELDDFLQEKYQDEVKEIFNLVKEISEKTMVIYENYKTKIQENIKIESKAYLKDLILNFKQIRENFKQKAIYIKNLRTSLIESFTTNSNSIEQAESFLKISNENNDTNIYDSMNKFLEDGKQSLKDYSLKNINQSLMQECYLNMMSSLKGLINAKILKNQTNTNNQKILMCALNNQKKEEKIIKFSSNNINNANNLANSMNNGINNKNYNSNIIDDCVSIEKILYEKITEVQQNIIEKKSFDIEIGMILDICLIGPLNENEYYLASCSVKEKYIRIWTISFDKSPLPYKVLEGHNKSTYKLYYCQERKCLMSAGMDGSVKSWDINKNWELGIYYKEDSDPVSSITYIPDFDMFATSHTLFIRLWKVNKEVFVKNEAEYPVQQPSDLILIPIDSEKCKVMVSTEKGTILFFDYLILNGKAYIKSKKDPIQAHSKSIYKLLLIKKNNNVISCCKEENKLIVWNPLTMEKLQELIFNEGKSVKGIIYNENLNNFIITSGINKIWIMKQNENKLEIEGIIEKDENLLINEVSQLENKEFNLIITSACERKNSGKKGMENSYILKYIFV